MSIEEYLKKYPWLAGYDPDVYDGEDPVCCVLGEVPRGWIIAFGELFCEEIDAAIKKLGIEKEFHIFQMKEKYGELRCYCDPCPTEIHNIIYKYATISQNVCCECGELDSPTLALNWISPYCEKCFNKMNTNGRYGKFEYLAETDGKIANEVRWTRYTKDNTEEFRLDISDTVKKLREYNEERKKQIQFDNEEYYYGA